MTVQLEGNYFRKNEMIPVGARIEIHNGKLLFDDEARLVLLAMLLENIGPDKVVSHIHDLQELFDQKQIEEDEKSRDSAIYAESDEVK